MSVDATALLAELLAAVPAGVNPYPVLLQVFSELLEVSQPKSYNDQLLALAVLYAM